MLPLALALGASALYGVSDFLGGLRSRSLPLISVLVVSQVAALVLTLLAAAIALPAAPSVRHLLFAAGAGLAIAVGIAALFRGLAVGKMGIVAPIAATAAVVPVVVAFAIGEEPSALQAAGIGAALAGVVVISAAHSGRAGGSVGESVLWGAIAAAGIGAWLVTLNEAGEGGVIWALLVARAVAVAIFLLALFATRGPSLGTNRRGLREVVGIGVLIAAADALYAWATTEGELGAVAVLSSLYPVVTIALARVYLDERISRTQALGAAVVFAGVAAISAG